MIELQGIAVYKGIETENTYLYNEQEVVISDRKLSDNQIEDEVKRFIGVQKHAKIELEELKQKAMTSVGQEESEIFEAHLMMMEDPMLIDMVIGKVRRKLSLEKAIDSTKDELMGMFLAIDDPYLKARAADVKDVTERLIRISLGIEKQGFENLDQDVILIAKDLKPSETAQLNDKIKGILLQEGSETSHAAIMAKAKGIPTIVGIEGLMGHVNDGDYIIMDSIHNKVMINPSQELIDEYKKRKAVLEEKKKYYSTLREQTAVTKDGKVIKLYGNIGSEDEVPYVKENGGKGVGLFRTEFVYMDAKHFPTEEEQFRKYKKAVEFGLEDVIIRTLDIGGDKNLPYFAFKEEENPFLGLRALRFTLAHTEIFKQQLRAILRASHYGHTSVMFPMVSSVEEVLQAKELLAICQQELKAQGIPYDEKMKVGIMIEIPAAAAIADMLIDEVDFFSIGTNDLCQYTLAVDRMNKDVAYLYQPLHPAILRLIHQVANAAASQDKEAGVCGEMAGDPVNAYALIGLGITELSMSPAVIPEVKSLIRDITFEQAQSFAKRLLNCKTSTEVKKLLKEEVDL